MRTRADSLRSSRAVVGWVLHDRASQAVFLTTSGLVTLAYSLLLPYSFTQRLSLHNWHFLDARLLAFSIAFGIGVGGLLTLQLYGMRRAARSRGGGLGGAAAGLGVLPSLLCCTPIVPIVLGFVGFSGASLIQTSGKVQSFFATKQNLILGTSLFLIAVAVIWATRRIANASCTGGEGCDAPPVSRGGNAEVVDSTRPSSGPRRQTIGGHR